ncbi:hypothetical protein BASA81_003070 [Batrachochytrium salamandrivorans]|nr:hypothetical protein BASA81_003070 [Batrachochytrium salamandrivorans]
MNFARKAAGVNRPQMFFSAGQKRNFGVKKNAAFVAFRRHLPSSPLTPEFSKNAFSLFIWAFGVPYVLLVTLRASEIHHDMSGKNWKNPNRTMVKYY